MKKLYKLILFYFLLLSYNCFSATFTASTSGNWNNIATWGGAGIPTSADIVNIGNFTVTIPDSYMAEAFSVSIANNAASVLTVSALGSLTIGDGTSGGINFGLTSNRGRLNVFGRLIVNHGATMTGAAISSRFYIYGTGTYVHNYLDGGSVYTPNSWPVGSTLEITNLSGGAGIAPSGLSQNFYNVLWNCPNQATDIDLNGTFTTVNGGFGVSSTGTDQWYLILSANTTYSLTIGNNLNISGNSIVYFSQGTAVATINVGGDLNYTVTSTVASVLAGGSGNVTMNVNGNANFLTTDEFLFTEGSALGILNLFGNFTLTGGVVNTSPGGTGQLNFIGTTMQNFTSTGSMPGRINYTVGIGSILNLGTNSLTGTGTFTLSADADLMIGSPQGIVLGNTSGNIRVTGTRTFSSNGTAEIIYNGLSKQFLGNGYPNVEINLTINNPSNVEIAGFNANIQANSTLSLLAGSLIIGGNQLVIDGNLTASGGTITTTSGSTIIVNGTGNLSTIPFATSPTIIGYFTINRGGAGNVPIGNALTVTSTLDLQLGNLVFNGQTLTITGNLANNGGNLYGNSTSRLILQGTGALTGAIPFDPAGNSIKTFAIDRNAGTVTLGSALTISDTLALTQGALTTTVLTLGNNATLIKSTGTISNAPLVTGSNAYNVTYGSGVDILTGNELPATGTALNNLTIARNSGTVTLASGITVNGNLTITSGGLSTSGSNFPISVLGNFTNNSTFTPNASTITFSGSTAQSIGGTVATSFNNLTSTNASGIGLTNDITVAGALDISNGALTINSRTLTVAGTITSGNLTGGSTSNLIINGTGSLGGNLNFTQTSAETRTLRNFTLNRTGGTVALGTPLDLAGVLTLTTGTLNTNSQALTVNLNSAAIDGSGSGAITGNLTVSKTLARAGYVDFGTALNGVTYSDLSNSGALLTNPFVYDETQHDNLNYGSTGWVTPPAVLAPTQGVTARVTSAATTIDATGTYAHTDQVASLTYTTPTPADITQDGFNLIANPFPSVLDWNAVTKPAYVDNSLYYYVGAGTYVSYVNGTPSGQGLNQIPSMQGFFVKANASCVSPCSFTLPKAARLATAKANFREGAISNVLKLKVSSGNFNDATYIKFDTLATASYDRLFDAYKFKNSEGVPSIYSVLNKVEYSINALPFTYVSKVIPVKVEAGFDGEYSLELSEDAEFDTAYSVTLVDTRLNKSMDFKSNPVYTYAATKADTATRFYLNLKFNEVITGVDSEMGSAMVLSNTGNIVTTRFKNVMQSSAVITVSDMLGHEVYHNDAADISSGIFNFALMNNPTGIYLVKVLTGDNVLSGKILIKN